MLKGEIENCRVTASSGSALLDDTACKLVARRGRYTPAKDASGNPTPAVPRRCGSPGGCRSSPIPLTPPAALSRPPVRIQLYSRGSTNHGYPCCRCRRQFQSVAACWPPRAGRCDRLVGVHHPGEHVGLSLYIMFTKLIEQQKIFGQAKRARQSVLERAPNIQRGRQQAGQELRLSSQLVDDGILAQEQHTKLDHPIDRHEWMHTSLRRSEAADRLEARQRPCLPRHRRRRPRRSSVCWVP